tara:strand:- start:728 stop:1444 length:717 start_codon:yes stop_codon:yes gene_type:complete
MNNYKLAGAAVALGIAYTGQGQADFGEAIRSGEPGQVQVIVAKNEGDNGSNGLVVKPTLKYKGDGWFASAGIPVVDRTDVDGDSLLERKVSGIGDVGLELGRPFHIGDVHMMGLMSLSLPSGGYDSQDLVNVGSGRINGGASLLGTKVFDEGIVDVGLVYNLREGLPNKYTFRSTAGINVGEHLKAGVTSTLDLVDGDVEFNVKPIVRYTPTKGKHVTVVAGKNSKGRNISVALRVSR